MGVDYEWLSLERALDLLLVTGQPYAAFSLFMEALQSAGLSALVLMAYYAGLRSIGGLLLSLGVVLTTVWFIVLKRQAELITGGSTRRKLRR